MSKRKDHSSGAPILQLLAARALRKRGWRVKLPHPVRRPGFLTRAASSALGAALGWVLPGALSNTRIDPEAYSDLAELFSGMTSKTVSAFSGARSQSRPDIIDTDFVHGPAGAPPPPSRARKPFVGVPTHGWSDGDQSPHVSEEPDVGPHPVGPPIPFIGFLCSLCGESQANAPPTMSGGVTTAEALHLGWKYLGHSTWLCPVCAAATEPSSTKKSAKKVSPGPYVNPKTGKKIVIGRVPTEPGPVAEEPGSAPPA